MPVAVVFPGQGSQAVGMGRDLFARYPDAVDTASSILGYSLAELCSSDPHKRLAQTAYTQPAMYVVNALAYRAWLERTGRPPDLLAGHSLGEYDALLAADVFDFETGLRLVQRRGALMSEVQGGMAAVIGLSARRVRDALDLGDLDALDVANFNSYTQVVLAGPRAAIDAAIPVLQRAGARHVVALPVSAPFHSRYMQPVADRFRADLDAVKFRPPQIPVVSNVWATPYRDGEVADTLARQIAAPVRWIEVVETLMRSGRPEFEEVGQGTVLTGLIRQIREQSVFVS